MSQAILRAAEAELERAYQLLESRADRPLDVGYVARRLSVAPETVREWIRAGRIAVIQTPNHHYKIPASELFRILQARKSSKSPKWWRGRAAS